MSQENVEVVRRVWEAYTRRDNEAAFALYDPEIEIDLTASGFPGAGVYHGLEGVRSWNRDWRVRRVGLYGRRVGLPLTGAWVLKMRNERLPDFQRAMYCRGWLQDTGARATTVAIAEKLGWDRARAEMALGECRNRGLLSH